MSLRFWNLAAVGGLLFASLSVSACGSMSTPPAEYPANAMPIFIPAGPQPTKVRPAPASYPGQRVSWGTVTGFDHVPAPAGHPAGQGTPITRWRIHLDEGGSILVTQVAPLYAGQHVAVAEQGGRVFVLP